MHGGIRSNFLLGIYIYIPKGCSGGEGSGYKDQVSVSARLEAVTCQSGFVIADIIFQLIT